jgi:hypothetical protein
MDFQSFIRKNYNNLISSVQVVNNKQYINEFLSYFYDIGLKKPNDDCRVLINQLNFQSSTNFNNVYGVVVPALGATRPDNFQLFVSQPQKQLIIDEIEKFKVCTQNFVPIDPVYYGFNVGLALITEDLLPSICDETFIVITQSRDTQKSQQKIKSECFQVLKEYFSTSQTSLGQIVNVQEISDRILSIPGVSNIKTRRISEKGNREIEGLNLFYWNLTYPADDIRSTQQNVKLKFFQYPFLFNNGLENRIIIEDE